MSGLAKRGRGMPCAACAAARVLPEQSGGHGCTGLAAFADGSVPCPCCGTVTPMRFCRSCDQLIRPGELYDTQLAQSASGGARATNHVHKQCPPRKVK